MSFNISVIVPVAAGETLWRELLPLVELAEGDEGIVAAAEPPPADWSVVVGGRGWRWLCCRGRGRAAQMNEAAEVAGNPFLWFVHADSRPAPNAGDVLRRALGDSRGEALWFFGLRFYDGGRKMRINEWGVRWRCRLFGNPFGDQAFCLSAGLFVRLGGYDEAVAYGEDQVLALRARRAGARLVALAAVVGTSARRYEQFGWWRTVGLYQGLWWRQWRGER